MLKLIGQDYIEYEEAILEKINNHRWLAWAREIEAISQTGLHYAENEFDKQRYTRLMQLSSEIVENYSSLNTDQLMTVFTSQLGYATPKVDVRAAVFQQDKLLMVQERSDGGWTLPGGWADVGDIPSRSAERETWEEAGYRVKAQRIIGVYDANRTGPLELFHAYKLIYLCDLVDGSPRPSYETSDVAFFGRNEIPKRFSGERTRPRHIRDAFAIFENPNAPAFFD
jgi:8-oxo-dGTP pyrophosphatase MutT (NUDIX family)